MSMPVAPPSLPISSHRLSALHPSDDLPKQDQHLPGKVQRASSASRMLNPERKIMNIVKAMTVWTPRRSKLAFGLACALIAGAGWCAKRGLDRINSDFEAIYDLLYDTSPMLGWVDQR